MEFTHYKLNYMNGNCLLSTENKPYVKFEIPSIEMVVATLDSIRIENKITDISMVRADLYYGECEGFITSYRLPLSNN